MVDYTAKVRRSLPKEAARFLLTRRPVNALAVRLLRLLPDNELRSRLPVIGGTARLTLDGGAAVTLCNTDKCGVAMELFWNDGELRNPADRLALRIMLAFGAESELFLDIGAYTGLFALAVARRNPRARCLAYEIVPENFQCLWENVFANDLVGRVVPEIVGIGSEAGSLTVPRSLGLGLLASSVALDSQQRGGVRIPVDSIDNLHPDFTGPATIKIDVEGFEWNVLQGARRFIARNRPDIVCEVLRRAPNIAEVRDFVVANGYRVYHITANGLVAADAIVPSKVERDWLFTVRSESELAAAGLAVAAA